MLVLIAPVLRGLKRAAYSGQLNCIHESLHRMPDIKGLKLDVALLWSIHFVVQLALNAPILKGLKQLWIKVNQQFAAEGLALNVTILRRLKLVVVYPVLDVLVLRIALNAPIMRGLKPLRYRALAEKVGPA